MPFAQFGYPHQGRSDFESRFPADYITEAIDQTRGWFYSQLMVSTLVFDEQCCEELGIEPQPYPHPFRNCIVLGHVADPTGKKESKSLGNYTPPEVIFDDVAQDFAVMSSADVPRQPSAGEALISKQDLEALDLKAGDQVTVAVCDSDTTPMPLTVRPAKFVPRRSILLSAQDLESIGARVSAKGKIAPIDVPRLPAAERVTLAVPTPAPRRGRIPLVLLGWQPAMVANAALAGECADDPEGVSAQAQERLLFLHDLRRHRWLRPEHNAGPACRGTRAAGSLDPI